MTLRTEIHLSMVRDPILHAALLSARLSKIQKIREAIASVEESQKTQNRPMLVELRDNLFRQLLRAQLEVYDAS